MTRAEEETMGRLRRQLDESAVVRFDDGAATSSDSAIEEQTGSGPHGDTSSTSGTESEGERAARRFRLMMAMSATVDGFSK
jgi:hypothetical protein